MDLGRAIKTARTMKGLTQTDLAEYIDISVSYLSLLERNKRDPAFSVIGKISEALDMPLFLLIWMATNTEEELDQVIVEKLSDEALKRLR